MFDTTGTRLQGDRELTSEMEHRARYHLVGLSNQQQRQFTHFDTR